LQQFFLAQSFLALRATPRMMPFLFYQISRLTMAAPLFSEMTT
jgi:hypothetical protein